MKRLNIPLIIISVFMCACGEPEMPEDIKTPEVEQINNSETSVLEPVISEPAILDDIDSMRHFYGDYVSLDTDSEDAMYILNYLVMDCCEEWNDITAYADTIPDACAIEGFEVYCYDMSTSTVPTGKCAIIFHPTEEFLERDYETVTVYHFGTQTELPTEITENGDIKAEANNLDGIFLLTKKIKGTTNDNLWISNVEDCNDQCRSCSDDW